MDTFETEPKQTILTIDDEPTIRQSFRAYLEDFDHLVLEADNGHSGLEIFKEKEPDLVLLDLNMPEMDGLAVLERMREMDTDVPIIVISGTGRLSDVAQALRLGAWDYLFKPIRDLTVLEHAIDRAFERARLLRENKLYQHNLEKQVEQRTLQLRTSEEKYRQIFNNLQDIYFETSPEGLVLEISPSITFSSQYNREDLIGKNIASLYDSIDQRANFINSLVAQGELRDFELLLRDKDQSVLPCSVTARVIQHEDQSMAKICGSIRNISDRKKAEEALKESEHRYRSLVSNIPVGLYRYSLDSGGGYITVNQAMANMLGHESVEALLLTHPNDLYQSPEEQERFLNTLLSKGEINGKEIQTRKPNGELIWTSITAYVYRNDLGIIQYIDALIEDISKRKTAEERVKHLSYYDVLTDLPNRTMFTYRLKQAIASSQRNAQYGGIVILDLDRFKSINDSLGHQLGDAFLKKVAAKLKSMIRDEDTVARTGGDEFGIVFSELSTSLSEAGRIIQVIAEKIRQELAKPFFIDNHDLYITASLGIAMFPSESNNAEEILKHASTAVSRVKENERNTCLFYLPDMQEEVLKRLTIEKELRTALQEDQFELFYQPQVDGAGKTIGAEALIRWIHPDKGIISPLDFIPVAEETGLIVPIGTWVLQTACTHLKKIEKLGLSEQLESISINVSPFQFRQVDFTTIVENTISMAGVPPTKLSLEITEGIAIDNLPDTIDKMLQLKELGIKFSIDDFGTGYSSLSYLSQLPVSQIKIDKSFVMGITNDSSFSSIVSTIIVMAKSLGFGVVAEGVETESELNFLLEKECQIFQGYYFSRPVPFGEFIEKLKCS